MHFQISLQTRIEVETVEIDLKTGFMTLRAKLYPLNKHYHYKQNQVVLGTQLDPNIFDSIKDQIYLIAKHNLQKASDEVSDGK